MNINTNNPMGVLCTDTQTSFKVFAPFANSVQLNVYASDTAKEPSIRKKLSKSLGGCFECTVLGNLSGRYYTYTVDGMETIDPYAKSGGANSRRGLIFKDGSADPDGWDNDTFIPQTPIIWEVHVRDFSSDKWLNLPDAGKYSAFRRGVTTPDGKPALVDYLNYLGVTYVQLQPVFDFGSVDEVTGGYNWGYDPVCYFMPEGSYSSDPHDGFARVRELKQLIMTLHSVGIGVIMDVVFNHTYKKEGSPLDVCAPDYYYRMQGGRPANGSGCGNETRSESPMFRKLMTDCVCYFAKEYHIDGFRFDLMGLHDIQTMNEIRATLDNMFEDGRGRNILMYGEPWYCFPPSGIEGADKAHLHKLDSRIGVFNDTARDGIRGGHFNDCTPGFVQGELKALDEVLSGICGGAPMDGCAFKEGYMGVKSPTQQVLYSACHDNYTLYDQLVKTAPDSADANRIAVMHRMADFLVMSGLGLPFMLAGQEFMRTKFGDGNSYRSGDKINKLNWRRMSEEWESVNYYRGLIELRKFNGVFADLSCSRAHFSMVQSPYGTAVYIIGNVVYAVNNTDEAVEVELPVDCTVAQVCDIERAGVEPFAESKGKITVEAHNVFAGIIK